MCSPDAGRTGPGRPCRFRGGPPPRGAAAQLGSANDRRWVCRSDHAGLPALLVRRPQHHAGTLAAAGGAVVDELRSGRRPGAERSGRRIGRLPRFSVVFGPSPESRAGALPSDPGRAGQWRTIQAERRRSRGGLVGCPNSVRFDPTRTSMPIRLHCGPCAAGTLHVSRHPASFTSCGSCADRETEPKKFRESFASIVAARHEPGDVEVRPLFVTTPMETTDAHELGVRIGGAILRAGLGMVDAMLELMPDGPRSASGPLPRPSDSPAASSTTQLPDSATGGPVPDPDPMLATGGSADGRNRGPQALGRDANQLVNLIVAPRASMRHRRPPRRRNLLRGGRPAAQRARLHHAGPRRCSAIASCGRAGRAEPAPCGRVTRRAGA